MTDKDDHQLRPQRPSGQSTRGTRGLGEVPGVFAEEEIELGFALICRDNPNSQSDWDSILATVAVSVLRRTTLNQATGPQVDGLLVFVIEDNKRKKNARIESPVSEAHVWFEAACEAIEYLSDMKPSQVTSRVSIPVTTRMQLLVCREGQRTSIYLQTGDLTYLVSQDDKFITALTRAFHSVGMPTRLAARQIVKRLSH